MAAPIEVPVFSGQPLWHTLTSSQALDAAGVAEQQGLSSTEAAARAERFGPNKFAEAKTEPRWRAFIRQYADLMQIVLVAAGILSLYPLRELGTGLLLLFLTLFNAVLGLRQEGEAATAVAALRKMMIIKAKVKRDGQLVEIPAEQLVPGDVVSLEAGDIVPADGRLLKAATLEVAEAALTGNRGEPAGVEGHRPGRGTRDTAGGPHRHGVHEHQCHPRLRRGSGDSDRHDDRGRPHLGHAADG